MAGFTAQTYFHIDPSAHRKPTHESIFQGKPYHTRYMAQLKGRLKHTHMHRHTRKKTQREAEPHFGGFSSHVLPFRRGAWWTPALRTRVKATTAAGVGHVQLNFPTAGREQCWKIISCSDTRPASIIQRCVLLGDLIFFPSRSCPSSASANRSLPSFLTRKDFSRMKKNEILAFFFKVLELFSLPL